MNIQGFEYLSKMASAWTIIDIFKTIFLFSLVVKSPYLKKSDYSRVYDEIIGSLSQVSYFQKVY